MYDLTNLDTFEKLTNWLQDIKQVNYVLHISNTSKAIVAFLNFNFI